MRDVIHVTESDTALKFSSQYIAEDLGFFDDVGLAVSCDVDAGPGGSWLVDNLISGRAQVAMGGIWLPMLYTQVGLGVLCPGRCSLVIAVQAWCFRWHCRRRTIWLGNALWQACADDHGGDESVDVSRRRAGGELWD